MSSPTDKQDDKLTTTVKITPIKIPEFKVGVNNFEAVQADIDDDMEKKSLEQRDVGNHPWAAVFFRPAPEINSVLNNIAKRPAPDVVLKGASEGVYEQPGSEGKENGFILIMK